MPVEGAAPGDPGGLINVSGVGVLKSAPNPEGAQAFAAYLVGESAQKYFAQETAEYPLVAGVAPSAEMPPLGDLQPLPFASKLLPFAFQMATRTLAVRSRLRSIQLSAK